MVESLGLDIGLCPKGRTLVPPESGNEGPNHTHEDSPGLTLSQAAPRQDKITRPPIHHWQEQKSAP